MTAPDQTETLRRSAFGAPFSFKEKLGMKENENKNPLEDQEKPPIPSQTDDEVPMSATMRVLRAKGEDQQNEHESQYTGKKVGKLENFWYQHKWHAGLTAFCIVIAAVLLWQILTYVAPDAYIMYTGPVALIGSRYTDLETAITQVMEDYNGDGVKAISFTDNTYLTEEQIAEKQEEGGYQPDYGAMQSAYSRFQAEINAAKHMLCMLDPSLYEPLRDMGGFMPLSDIFGEDLPESAADEYGIRLGDTAFYKEFPGVRILPANTILAVRSEEAPGIQGSKKKLEALQRHAALLRAIAEYTPDSAE